MLLTISKKPKMARGMPIGAATNETVKVMPTIMNIIPIMAATTRPVNFIMKLKMDHTRTNGRSKRGVFLWFSMSYSSDNPQNVSTIPDGRNKKAKRRFLPPRFPGNEWRRAQFTREPRILSCNCAATAAKNSSLSSYPEYAFFANHVGFSQTFDARYAL